MRYLSCLLVLVAACHTRPEFEYRTASISVRANTPGDARTLATLAERLSPQVAELLGVEPDSAIVIDFDDDRPALGHLHGSLDRHGRLSKRRIELGSASVPWMRFVVAHELTHWYSVMNDSAWDRLPYSLLEGVADSVGLRLAPEMETKQRGFWGQILEHTTEAEFERLVFTSYKEHLELSEQDGEKMRAVAFSVVDEIGIERLRELCERAQRESLLKVPPQWLADLVKQPRKLAR